MTLLLSVAVLMSLTHCAVGLYLFGQEACGDL